VTVGDIGNGMQATAEYYTVRLYRRGPVEPGKAAILVGVIEDVEGRQQVFHCSEELWAALLGRLDGARPSP
jgi:hypothetical protein